MCTAIRVQGQNDSLLTRPYSYLIVVSSVDGRISKAPDRSMWEDMADTRTSHIEDAGFIEEIETELSRKHKPVADMLGSNSLVEAEGSLIQLPTCRGNQKSLYQDFLPDDVLSSPDRLGWLIVVDGQGRLRSGWKGGNPAGWHMLHLTSFSVPCEYLAFLRRKRIPYLIAGESMVDLKTVFNKLKLKLGISCVKTTAGGKLGGALLRSGLLDEINIIFSPYLAGGRKTPKLFDSRDIELSEPFTRLKLTQSRVSNKGHILVRYKVLHQESEAGYQPSQLKR